MNKMETADVYRKALRHSDPDSPYNITNENRVVWIVFVMLLLIAFVVIAVIFIGDKTVDNGKQTLSERRTCGYNSCVVDLAGVKTCPASSSDRLKPGRDGSCVARDSCPLNLPYAISLDGSALTFKCDQGDACNCTAQARCPSYITAFMRAIDKGNISGDYARESFDQKIVQTAQDKTLENFPPYSIDPNGNNPEFCSVASSVARSIFPSKCVKGLLMEIVDEEPARDFDPLLAKDYPLGLTLGCVATKGDMAPEDGLPMFVKSTGKVIQRKTTVCEALPPSTNYDEYYYQDCCRMFD